MIEYIDHDPIAEVRRNREMLLEKHGGVEGLRKHMAEQRPLLEKQGWTFVTPEEVRAKRRARDSK